MKTFLAALAIAAIPFAAQAENPETVAEKIARWDVLNETCRGGYPSQPETLKACDTRDALYPEIEADGFCFGENAEFGYQSAWDVCNAVRK